MIRGNLYEWETDTRANPPKNDSGPKWIAAQTVGNGKRPFVLTGTALSCTVGDLASASPTALHGSSLLGRFPRGLRWTTFAGIAGVSGQAISKLSRSPRISDAAQVQMPSTPERHTATGATSSRRGIPTSIQAALASVERARDRSMLRLGLVRHRKRGKSVSHIIGHTLAESRGANL